MLPVNGLILVPHKKVYIKNRRAQCNHIGDAIARRLAPGILYYALKRGNNEEGRSQSAWVELEE